jgi:hypothetical protein
VSGWIVRSFVVTVGAWYLIVPTAVVVTTARHEEESLTSVLVWNLLLRGLFGALLVAGGVTADRRFAWAGVGVLSW